VTPGIIGTIQANEVIRYLLGSGELLTNRLFIWDGMQAHAEELCVERNPACKACSGMTTTKTARKKK
jgi:adenylyltransferase/sulfurtransferase